MGMSGISTSQVSRLCVDIDERVNAFLSRPIEGDWPYLWIRRHLREVAGGRPDRVEGQAVTIAVAVNTDDVREVLGMSLGPSGHAERPGISSSRAAGADTRSLGLARYHRVMAR
jgi:putative transposase